MNVRLRRYPTTLLSGLTRAIESGLAIRAYAAYASRSSWLLRPSDQGSQIRLGSLPHDLVSAIFFSTMPRYCPSFRSPLITSANGFSSKIAADHEVQPPIPPLFPSPPYSPHRRMTPLAVSVDPLIIIIPKRSTCAAAGLSHPSQFRNFGRNCS